MNRVAPAIDNNLILTLVREHEYTPMELLAKLEKDRNLPDEIVKEALARLLWLGILSLSSEHTLKINPENPPTSSDVRNKER